MSDPVVTRPTGGRGAADRVRRSHAQTRTTLRLALAYFGAAAVFALWSTDRWLPLHLLLAGGAMLAISGVSLMLTVTWSAAPAPAERWVAGQRICVAVGAAGIALGREADLPAVVGVAGTAYLAGLVTLAGLLLVTVRRGVQRRFDVAVAAYLAALAAGAIGVGLGIAMAVGSPSAARRSGHVTLNLLGLVGLVIAGTMPFFASTVGRSRMSPRARPAILAVMLGWLIVSLAVSVVGLSVDASGVAAGGLAGYAGGVGIMLALLPRPTVRQLDWAGPRLLALWAGGLWWVTAVVATAVDVASGRLAFGGRWVLVLALGAYAQILWGSLAYLLPMLRGGGAKPLADGFGTTRSWVGLGAANVAALSLATALPSEIVAVALAVWLLDSARRAATVGTVPFTRADRGIS